MHFNPARDCFPLLAALTLLSTVLLADTAPPPNTAPTQLALPPLHLDARPARAHTQGLELVDRQFYVTARREDSRPRSALLLRTGPERTDWDAWHLAADDASLDHPGGFQSDGRHLWIPVAESRRGGRTRIGAFALAALQPDRTARPEFEFSVDDHIGAIAVSRSRSELLGANWDTEIIYVWNFKGRLKRRFATVGSTRIGLGSSATGGLAIQDWKVWNQQIFASGLVPGLRDRPEATASRLLVLPVKLQPRDIPREIPLPPTDGIELSREGMAIADGAAWFLPGDLGASNRLYRVPLPAVLPPSPTKSR